MIGRLAGTLVAVEPEAVLVDVNGVGYVVGVSTRTLAALPPPGAAVTLAIETMVREDAITLYGFLDTAERAAFRTLLTVQGVGAKVALALLGAFSPGQIAAAVATGDAKTLTRASGVGARLAARLVTELKGKPGFAGTEAIPAAAVPAPPSDPLLADAVSALANLGYRRAEAEPALAAARRRLGDAASVEALIREGLKALAR
ncbi:Holliday junction branch migration protein RuvA [Elioraea sp.]|jgi:Holliday junction DNA helicase RuvA|uniref:Holliday junction branch migration protein RuvA n=1 Tax=Elioraea sp. TaxID=2185103 RepID=UPI0021DEC8DD|nr:Holliday junction branch migration protein RuvA [Elioraea sp.]GIX11227.1 MAG: Holliday junction ATP-dependent DNA helicase RuvA [Elioraea sp.]